MKAPSRKQTVYIVGAILGVIVFIAIAQWSQQYSELLTDLATRAGWKGVLSYITIMAASIKIVPEPHMGSIKFSSPV